MAIIVLNWHAWPRTEELVHRVRKWTALQPALIVVSNGESAEHRKSMRKVLDQRELACNSTNLGFAGGNNVGIGRARALGAKFILLLNSDVVIAEGVVLRLLDTLEQNPDLAVVGPVIEENSANGSVWFAGGRDISRYLGTRRSYNPGDATMFPGTLRDVDYVPGMVVLFRAEALDRIGLLDEDYFFSGEVADICERVRNQGMRVAVDLSVSATHETAASGGRLRDSLYVYYGLRNRFLFIRKHRRRQRWLLALRWSALCLLISLKAILNGNRARARAAALAVVDGLRNRFGNRNSLFGY